MYRNCLLEIWLIQMGLQAKQLSDTTINRFYKKCKACEESIKNSKIDVRLWCSALKKISASTLWLQFIQEYILAEWLLARASSIYVLAMSIGHAPEGLTCELAKGGPLGLTIVGGIAGLINLSDARLLDAGANTWP